jgi:hypothetical protein
MFSHLPVAPPLSQFTLLAVAMLSGLLLIGLNPLDKTFG